MKRLLSIIIPFVLLVVITLIAAYPLFDSRPLDGHDPGFNMIRLQQVHTLLSHGTIIPRWAPDLVHGYGYPLFIFYPALSYMVAEPFHAVGISLDASLKCVYILGFLFAALFMYLIGKSFGSSNAGLIGAALYTLAPYRLVDVYVRVSYTEFFAMSLFPYIFWSLLRCAQTDKQRFAVSALIGLVVLNLTHSISALILYPASFLWVVILGVALQKPLKHVFYVTGMIYVCAVGMTAFFWVPALLERQYVRIDRMISGAFSFEHHFVTLAQLFSFKWGYAISQTGLPQAMSFQIGWPQVIAIALCAGCICYASRRIRTVMIFLLIGIVLAVFCMLPASEIVWKIVPLLAYLQFPWRLLMLVALLASLAGVFAVVQIEKRCSANWIWIVCLAGICLYSIPYCKTYYIDEPLFEQTIEHNIQQLPLPYGSSTLLLEYLPKWTKKIPERPAERLFAAPDGIYIDEQVILPTDYRCTASVTVPGTLQVNTLYYPGWRCYVDGVRTKIKPAIQTGIMEIALDKTGTHSIRIVFENTPLRQRANWCSLLFCGIAVLFIMYLRCSSRHNMK